MMESKELLQQLLVTTRELIVPLMEDLRDAALVAPTPNGGNHATWIAGHLAYSEASLLKYHMCGEANPLEDWKEIFGFGSEPVASADAYPPYDELIAKFVEGREGSLKRLAGLTETELDQPSANVSDEMKALFGTYRQCFTMVALHTSVHRGQLTDCRRAAGRKPLFV